MATVVGMHMRFATLAVGVALLAGACSGGGGERLTVYSGRSKELVGPVLERFSEQTGIKVDVRYGDSADLALLIETEGDDSPADVFYSQSPGAIGHLASIDRLQALPDDMLGLVPERFRSPTGRWVGITGRVRVLVYNTDEVDPAELPGSVFDLTDPRFADRVGVAPSNGSFQDFITAMREAIGDDETAAWLDAMGDNGAKAYANNLAIVEAVGRGEITYGLVNHYYNLEVKAENPDSPTENYFFDGGDLGSLILVTGVGVLDSASHADDARQLAEFLLSPAEQESFASVTKEYPLIPGVAGPEGQPALDDIPAPTEDLTEFGALLKETKALIDASGIADN
jgi:iron(III) transport system substrate-binding protein